MTHPSERTDDDLMSEVSATRGRSGGPGGQHRNKVETHVTLTHRPTNTSAQAGERRSQADNKRVALFRLRLALAMEVRTERTGVSATWLSRVRGGKIRCNPSHRDFPALVAEALDQLHQQAWDGRAAADALAVSTSQLVRLLKEHPPALTRWNKERALLGLRALK